MAAFATKQLDRYETDKPMDELRVMLARFKSSRDGKEVISGKDLLNHATSNIFAGADTPVISLRAMFCCLCKNPRCYTKLVQEIDALESSNGLSRSVITFAESQMVAYLEIWHERSNAPTSSGGHAPRPKAAPLSATAGSQTAPSLGCNP